MLFGPTKVQFLSMAGQIPVGPSSPIEGIRVASLRDLAATKIKAIGDRGELRDYYDLMVIEERAGITAERALADYIVRWGEGASATVPHVVMALGYLGDVADDPELPIPRPAIESYWRGRQPEVAASLDSSGQPLSWTAPGTGPGPEAVQRPQTPGRAVVWVPPHIRDGHPVQGYWRRR